MANKMVKAMLLGVGMTLLTSVSALAYTDEGKAEAGEGLTVQIMEVAPDAAVPEPFIGVAPDGGAVDPVKRTAPDENVSGPAIDLPPDMGVTSPANPVSEAILEAQRRIDTYVFKEHYEDISRAGFTVSYTVPMEDYVEIGVTPYSQNAVDYLTKVLENEKIKVVEGLDPMIYASTAVDGDGSVGVPAGNEGEIRYTVTALEAEDSVVLDDAKGLENQKEVQLYTTAAGAEADKKASSALPIAGVAGGILLVGGGLLMVQRKKTAAEK
jgi:hypothetical protein